MANRLVPVLLLLVGVLALGACGKEIGDSCTLSQDCSPNGDRICDPDPNSPGGYCTVFGCDYSTCPGSSECVRFFTSSFSNRPCHYPPVKVDDVQVDDCEVGIPGMYLGSLDEQCSPAALTDFGGHCVSRSSEFRYCMKTCGSDGDCRDGYECRDFELMKAHGGTPVLAPPGVVDANAPKFCAAAPPG